MKKPVPLLLVLALCTSLAACGSSKGPGKEQTETLTNAYNHVSSICNDVTANA